MPSRVHGFPDGLIAPLWHFSDDSLLKAHPSYTAAKAGDMTAAVQLISDLAFPFLSILNPVMAMKSKKSSASSPLLSPPTKPTTSLASARLTRSEIDSLRQGKKQIADYAQKALKGKVSAALGLPR